MSDPFIGEIRITSFNFAPKGWALCNGQLLPINQNQALFALLGTTYGGNGQTNFALPDLRGRVPIHMGGSYTQGVAAGTEIHTLTLQEMPQHTHVLQASAANANSVIPNGNVLARAGADVYAISTPNATLTPSSITTVGGSQPHNNRQPYLVLNFIIALIGIFPSRN